VGVLLQQRTDASVIYDAHEDYGYNAIEFRDWIPDPIRPIIEKTFPTVQSVLANRLDAVITTSESIAQQFRDRGHDRVEVIHNYPRTEDIMIKEPPTTPTGEITLVYVGSLDHMRGLLPMLKLVRELVDRDVDVELWFLGTFSNLENEQRAMEFLTENEIEDYVKLHGYTPYEAIFSYLHAADIGLCLVDKKRFEHAIPTKMFEYMYSEIPVLATDATGTSTFITEETGWLVEQSDVEKQADIVEENLSKKEYLRRMGKKAKEQVKKEYSWEQEKKKLILFYNSLLEDV
jgi:glycosyltransferase involved in cell wall biosynthesis